MKKILALLLMGVFIASNCWGADINDWKRGDASIPVKGTDVISDADILISNYIVDPLDRLLTHYLSGCTLTYTSATTVTVEVGEVVCLNAGDTVRRFRKNTSTTTVDLTKTSQVGGTDDTGAEANSTTYYVYAVADASATTFTAVCSTSASAPTGSYCTYFRYLGSFYNNSSGNIEQVRTVKTNPTQTETDIDAWASVTYSGGVPTLQDSYNVSGITDTGTGLLTVTWDTDFASTNYCVVVTGKLAIAVGALCTQITTIATGSVVVTFYNPNANYVDPEACYIMAIGGQ